MARPLPRGGKGAVRALPRAAVERGTGFGGTGRGRGTAETIVLGGRVIRVSARPMDIDGRPIDPVVADHWAPA